MRKMNNEELFTALSMLEEERGIAAGYMLEKVKNAIIIAVKKDYEVEDDNVSVTMDPTTGTFDVRLVQDIVEEVTNPHTQISLQDAQEKKKRSKVGDKFETKLKTKDFGRIAAQTAKHVIRQGLREAERSQMYTEMQSKSHEIVTGVVTRVDNARGVVTMEIGKNEAMLPRNEQVPDEVLQEGEHVKVYVVDVTVSDRGPKVMISRTHPGLVKRMFEMEVPEIFDGTVEIKAIAREAGQRTKIAVWSKNPDVDPRGACIGAHGSRVANIVEELHGEKIDVVLWNEDPAEFIAAALSPAEVLSVEILDNEQKSCRVTVPDHQLSLAIGNKGQNARLCARLTSFNIDIRPESGYYGEAEEAEKEIEQVENEIKAEEILADSEA